MVAEFPELELHALEYRAPWDLEAIAHLTSIYLDFEELGLRQLQVVWDDGILSTDALPKCDLCSGEARCRGA